MRNIKLIIQYDGSYYSGWQKQDDERLITIQGEILKAIKNLSFEDVKLIASGRTDKGVHARMQVANFKTNTNIHPENYKMGINRFLPDTIQVIDAEEVPLEFNSRYDAKSKTYKYFLNNSQFMHPCYIKYKGHVYKKMDKEKIIEATKLFEGHHDFASFMGRTKDVNTKRTIDKIDLEFIDDDIIFTFKAESFLRNMIRIIIGSIIEVGKGKKDIDWIKNALENGNRELSGPTADPSGLYLWEVIY